MTGINWIILAFACVLLATRVAPLKTAIIGAGASGLTSAKNALDQNHTIVIYEKTEALGGVWWWTEKIGKNKYGVDIHSAMYDGLRCVL